ncbi:hypothetical protein C8Q74DRAFT_1370894 [Fomes fomentarius]|nr:hypothetical protein C8Q74DRAFT_1370894 [Fomes fomentarius]
MARLGTDVCARLKDANDHVVLVSCPTVQVVGIETHSEVDLCGFRIKYTVTLADDVGTVNVIFPVDFKVYRVGVRPNMDHRELAQGDMVTIRGMLRLYDTDKDEHVVLVHHVEVVTHGEQSPELQITELPETELERRIAELESELERMKKRLSSLVEPYARGLIVESVVEALLKIGDVADESTTAQPVTNAAQ